MTRLAVVGAGLAGSEAAWQLARLGVEVDLIEARPAVMTPAHHTADLAELVCSNSLGSAAPGVGHGLLAAEMALGGSLIIAAARAAAVPAGRALAVDRGRFAAAVTERLSRCPAVRVVRDEALRLPAAPAIVAAGPLAGAALAADLARVTGAAHLYFYDATSPIVDGDSIDRACAYVADRRGAGPGDYLNCPLTADEYHIFLDALLAADPAPAREFEDVRVFEGCMPIESLARRGEHTLRFGPMRPVGLDDPRTGRRPYAVVQLRREDAAGRLWNPVGFQTRLRQGDQQRVLRLIPALRRAIFLRYGVMHRNTYVDGPRVLQPDLTLRGAPGVRLAGQLAGVEGYMESAACGMLAAWFAAAEAAGRALPPPPLATMTGALLHHVAVAAPAPLQPMNANFGLLPPLAERLRKPERRAAMHERALAAMRDYLDASGLLAPLDA
jgi:methylenetetrahydrofolate--tRNA-(uracil-5-)-methyltransferase